MTRRLNRWIGCREARVAGKTGGLVQVRSDRRYLIFQDPFHELKASLCILLTCSDAYLEADLN